MSDTPMTQLDLDEPVLLRILNVRLMIFDVDGTLTDGGIYECADGSEFKRFNIKDLHGMNMLRRAGFEMALITGSRSACVDSRAEKLGIKHVYQRSIRKMEAFRDLLEKTGFTAEQAGFMGDDLIDIPVMRHCGFAITVPSAVEQVKPFAHYITRADAGSGAVREITDLLLKAQGRWEEETRRYYED